MGYCRKGLYPVRFLHKVLSFWYGCRFRHAEGADTLTFGLTACGMEAAADSDRDTENTAFTSTEKQSNSEEAGGSMTEESNTPAWVWSPVLNQEYARWREFSVQSDYE